MRTGFLALALTAWMFTTCEDARADAITLRTGDVLHGRVVENGESVVLEHEVLGRLTLAAADVAAIRRAPPVTVVELPVPPASDAAPVFVRTPAPRVYGAASDKGPWSHSVGLAMNTAQGNSDVLNIEADATSRYEGGVWAFEVGGHLLHTRSDGDTTAQHLHAKIRVERKLNERTYVFGQVLYDRDELADLDYRFTGTLGLGRVLAKTRVAELKGEIGAGLTHEQRSGLPSTTDPSGWLALDYERNWADGSKLTGALDFLPNFGDFDLSVTTLEVEYAKPMSEVMSLVFGLRLEHVIDPPAAKSLDTYFRAGLRFDW